MREFDKVSAYYDGNLALALAPALTPKGMEKEPCFFCGQVRKPLVIARGFLVLADIVSTRYFQYHPVALRDPVLSAHGDRLRAECFSACNGVYARMDLLQEGLDGEISFGTTNVDIGLELRKSLMRIKAEDTLHLSIGEDGLHTLHTMKEASRMTQLLYQRPVEMPDRWIRALGNCAEIHKNMEKIFYVQGIPAKSFIASLPSASGKEQSGWLSYSGTGVRLMPRAVRDSVYISGLHRLSALKRMTGDIQRIDFYAPKDGEKGPVMLEVKLPGAKLVLSLTAQSYQGYSGEGALLEGLAKTELLENTDRVASLLQFESKINHRRLASELDLSESDMESVLSVLASLGKLGFDAEEQAYFHRELPEEPERILKDNPRLIGARKLVDNVEIVGENLYHVHSGGVDYRVDYHHGDWNHAKCTCTWYLRHQNNRGPCKHILAVKLKQDADTAQPEMFHENPIQKSKTE